MLGKVARVDKIRQPVQLPADKNRFDEAAHKGAVVFGQVVVGSLCRPVHHAAAGFIRPQPRLNIVPMFHGLTVFEAKHLETDPPRREIVFGMPEDEVAILKSADNVHPGRDLGQPLEQGCQPLAPLLGLRIVLYVFRLVHDRDRAGIAGFDAFQQDADFIFVCGSYYSLPGRFWGT
jgi:hypothetical protein